MGDDCDGMDDGDGWDPGDGMGACDYFDNTPPPLRPIPPEKIAAARKAIEIMKRRQEDIANGYWPFGWEPDDNHRTYPDGCGGVIRLPNTERGRRAAWELEGS